MNVFLQIGFSHATAIHSVFQAYSLVDKNCSWEDLLFFQKRIPRPISKWVSMLEMMSLERKEKFRHMMMTLGHPLGKWKTFSRCIHECISGWWESSWKARAKKLKSNKKYLKKPEVPSSSLKESRRDLAPHHWSALETDKSPVNFQKWKEFSNFLVRKRTWEVPLDFVLHVLLVSSSQSELPKV